jgi:hypothetical protein
MAEEAHFFCIRFQQKGITQGAVNLERQTRETRTGANIKEVSLFRDKGGREQGIKEKLNHHPPAILQAGQVELLVPGPQFLQIDEEQVQLVVTQLYSKALRTLE